MVVETYAGKDVGKYIEPALRNSKRRIIVISPWISREYMDILINKARNNVKVTIVTTTKTKSLDSFKKICKKPSLKALFLSLLFPPLFLYLLIKRIIYRSFPLEIYVVDESHFIHSKIYVFDDKVITGSANLTRSGLWKNTESIVIFPKGEQKSVLNDVRKIINKAKKESILHINCLRD